jgi:DNA-binding response OmpR family regulator
MLPKLDGLSLIRSLREQGVETPVLILSALGCSRRERISDSPSSFGSIRSTTSTS